MMVDPLAQVERIVSGGEGQFLVKWKGLDYVDTTWEFYEDLQSEPDQVSLRHEERRRVSYSDPQISFG